MLHSASNWMSADGYGQAAPPLGTQPEPLTAWMLCKWHNATAALHQSVSDADALFSVLIGISIIV
ncbi:hypothetical protein KL86DES1_10551 [uncultured Desulfovibrio sp.]|uniref:Uncharacterized protein n=1 Tax=uncultured Desulfovibrio sp. TaxID=167968 RepID=A0A212KZE1_9BACT|nr:hypothetical protein KL86DES1_10551 [uncultured Desulfovibrio sp.]VZH32426.1 conserved protein of unknown function [Desulfovibrio sp. 86]